MWCFIMKSEFLKTLKRVTMCKCFVLCIFALVALTRDVNASLADELAETTQVCCNQGTAYARNHTSEDCSSSVTPDVPSAFGSLCIFAMDQCCKEYFEKKRDCDEGIELAANNKRCISNSDSVKSCCTECGKGTLVGARGAACEVRVRGSSAEELLSGDAFTQCCKKAEEKKKERSESHSSHNKHESASRRLTGNAVASLCEEYAPNELCAHHCIPVPGSYKCECNPGFMLMPDGRNCMEVTKNRCKPRNPCQHKCNDNGVEVKCSCKRGYKLMTDGKSCEDINECVLDPPVCLSGTECHNVQGSYKCIPLKKTNNNEEKGQCPPGFSKNVNNGACDDINECQLTHPPCPSYLCENTVGGYKCGGVTGDPANLPNNRPVVDERCPPGFKTGSTGDCEDVDECALHKDDCNPLSQFCINTRGSYYCQNIASKHCPPGFKIDPRTNKCEDINECEDGQDICRPDQICVNELGEYDCKLMSEYRPGANRCPDGMRMKPGSSVCEDIDECAEGTHLCDAYQNCLNTNGSHECNCKLGYELDSTTGACIDVNECATDQHNCIPGSQRCDNTVGSFLCIRFTSCGTGYILHHSTGQCEDIDECARGTHNCAHAGPNYQCENHPGSFRCVRKHASTTSTTAAPEYEYEYYDSEEEVTDGNQTQPITNQPPPKSEQESITTTTATPKTESPLETTRTTLPPISSSTTVSDNFQIAGSPEVPDEKDPRSNNVVPQPNYEQRPDERRPEESRPDEQQTATNYDQRLPEQPRPAPKEPRQPEKQPHQYPEQPRQPLETPEQPRNPEQPTQPWEPPQQPYEPWETPNQPRQSEQYPAQSRNPWETTEQARHPDEPKQPEKSSEDPRISWVPWKSPEQKSTEPVSNAIDSEQPETTYRSSEASPTPPQIVNVRVGEETATVQGKKTKDGSVVVDTEDVPKNEWTKVNAKPSDCQPGFEVDEYGACLDVDECSTNRHSCSSVTEICRNTMGGYMCDCAPGFRRDLVTGVCDIYVITTSSSTTSTTTLPPPTVTTSKSYFWGYPEYRPQTIRPFRPRNLCDIGFHFNSSTGKCEDINECTNGQANCAAVEICINTEGGYRCECPPNWRIDDVRHRCVPIRSSGQFPPGYRNEPVYPPLDPEDTSSHQVFRGKKYEDPAITSLGDRGSVITCRAGYKLRYDNTCEDIDECASGQVTCGAMLCTNLPGGYVCSCPPGHKLIGGNRCEDVDECSLGGNMPICSQNADCFNTIGSYQCRCHTGFRSAPVNDKVCVDVDECTESPSGSLCQQRCNNVWGGYTCSCHRGYRLNPDNRTCSDVDECTEFKPNYLCVGRCLNEPGSYRCACPQGYRLSEDKKSCIDIDECETGEAPCAKGGTYGSTSDVCVNTRGGYKCHRIVCPIGYKLESRHRCTRMEKICPPADWECAHQPSTYSYNFITFVSKLYIPVSKVDLFTLRGPAWPNAKMKFTLRLVDVNAPPTVKDRANINAFLLIQKGNQAVMSLVRSLEGPQSIELELSMELYNGEQFGGIAVARLYIFVSEYEF